MKNLFEDISLPLKAVIVGLLCGLIIWGALDFIRTRMLQGILTEQLTENLHEEAARNRILFDRYVKQHTRIAKLLASRQPLIQWIRQRENNEQAPGQHHYRNERPPWFPSISMWRGLIDPRHVLLRDKQGRFLEIYHIHDDELPVAVFTDRLLATLSQDQAYLTRLEGYPYLLASSPVEDSLGQLWGELVLISHLDDQFLKKLDFSASRRGAILALLEGGEGRVLASNNTAQLPVGMELQNLEHDYLVTGKPFFDYGASDLRLRLATFLPKVQVAALNERVLMLERRHNIAAAIIFITTFTLLIFLLSKRINQLILRISAFAQQTLASKQVLPKWGDQLTYLDARISLLMEEILAARDGMRLHYEAQQKAKQLSVLEAVTKDLGVGILFLGKQGKERILNQQMSEFEAEYGKEWYSVDEIGQRGEVVLKKGQHEPRIVRVSYLSLFEPNDVVLASDVTERMRAQKILQESAERFRNITESANDAIISVDFTEHIISWNKAASRIFGYSLSEVLGRPLGQLIPPQFRQAHAAKINQVRTTPSSGVTQKTLELAGLRKDGTSFPLELSVSTWTVEGVRYFTGIIRDITQRKEQEAQLLQAQKLEVIGQLTDGIVHDFNNLLTIILGNLHFLQEEVGHDVDDETREFIDDALSAARDGAELGQRLLAFSRKQTLQPIRIDINQLLDGLTRLLPRILGENIKLRINRFKDISVVFADRARIENALLNLAINARDAMPEGGTLTIETARQRIASHEAGEYSVSAPGTYILITVSDTGIGISSEDVARVIEPFYTTKAPGQGSGLGLSMVYDFTKQSGGGLKITSEPGKGTSVSILLPETAPTVEVDGEQESPGDLPLGYETILVVEDGARVRKLAGRNLTNLGYHVLEAENAVEAIKILSSESAVDLLFSDIFMPGPMNGRELADWTLANRPGLKVLLTTGFEQEVKGERQVNTDGLPLLKKPYTKEGLAQAVRTALDMNTSILC